MRASSLVRRHRPLAIGVAAAAALTFTTTTAQAAESSGERASASGDTAAASETAAAERKLDVQSDQITADLGPSSTGGSFIDDAGTLVVTVTENSDRTAVRDAGATPRVVDNSSRQLSNVHDSLDRFAEENGAGDVQGWHVDIKRNAVVVAVPGKAQSQETAKFMSHARSFGDRVTVDQAEGKATAAALYGGQQIQMSSGGICSSGFNAQTSSGGYAMLTAGHCAVGSPTFTRNGTTIGGTLGYSFPNNDYAAANINDPSYWDPQGAVDMHNGSARPVNGASEAPVGSELCKSGRTTGWTCGTIEAYDQTVNYGGGDIVYGLVRHNACVEQGDSGGSNMSGNYAQGLSSGGQLYQSGGGLVCGEKVGQPNVSYYQPVQEALSANNLTLLTN